jgi:hypothetical protein
MTPWPPNRLWRMTWQRGKTKGSVGRSQPHAGPWLATSDEAQVSCLTSVSACHHAAKEIGTRLVRPSRTACRDVNVNREFPRAGALSYKARALPFVCTSFHNQQTLHTKTSLDPSRALSHHIHTPTTLDTTPHQQSWVPSSPAYVDTSLPTSAMASTNTSPDQVHLQDNWQLHHGHCQRHCRRSQGHHQRHRLALRHHHLLPHLRPRWRPTQDCAHE